MKLFILILVLFVSCIGDLHLQADKHIVQFDISHILNARPVTTQAGNRLIGWRKGIDGDGMADGYLTMAAALFNGDKNPHALPDNPIFEANGSHPEIRLHYSNNDSLHNQACSMNGAITAGFSVPKARYSTIYLALTSAEGASLISIRLTYTDGNDVKNFTVPDYYQDIKPRDPNLCYLAHDLAKWGNKNNMTEKNHHNIDLLNVRTNPARILKGIFISKTRPGYLVLWAAAGLRARR